MLNLVGFGLVVWGRDMVNEHLGNHNDRFDAVHCGYGEVQMNFEIRMLLEFCLEKEL